MYKLLVLWGKRFRLLHCFIHSCTHSHLYFICFTNISSCLPASAYTTLLLEILLSSTALDKDPTT